MALFSVGPCLCGSDVWKLVDTVSTMAGKYIGPMADDSARVTSYACIYCGREKHRIQVRPVKRRRQEAE